MYGEDIDLSWRLVLGGWENAYFAGTNIIHYKGESTKKGSLNYVLVFYRAMLLFAAKHFEGSQARAFNWMIRLAMISMVLGHGLAHAIYARAGLAILRRMLQRWGMPMVVLLMLSLWTGATMVLIDSMWDKSFDWPLVSTTMAVLMAMQMLVMGALGGYRSHGAERSFAGQMLAWFGTSLVVLVIYSLLPEAWRFSRLAVISMVLGHGLAHGARVATVATVRKSIQNASPGGRRPGHGGRGSIASKEPSGTVQAPILRIVGRQCLASQRPKHPRSNMDWDSPRRA